MKNCVKCGAQIEDSAKFCTECGAEQTAAKQESTQEAGSSAPGGEYNTQAQNNYQQKPGTYDTGSSGKGQSIASLICGIASIVLSIPLAVVGIILGIVAICLGYSAKKKYPGTDTGLATGGFVTGIIGAVISAIVIVSIIALFSCAASMIPDAFNATGFVSPHF